MEIKDGQSEKVSSIPVLERMSWKTRILHGIIGLLGGIIFYLPVIWMANKIGESLFGKWDMGSTITPYVDLMCSLIFSIVTSVLGALIGGKIGYNNGHKLLGAILGCFASQTVNIILTTCLYWALH